jgi:hypothetical protein
MLRLLHEGIRMALTSENLVGYLRAEFAKTSSWRIVLFFLQFLVALPVAVSVIVPDHYKVTLYWLALTSGVLLAIWWVLNRHYLRSRSAAHAARRAALLLGGLNTPLSASEIQSLRERFTVNETEAVKAEKANYYATQLPPGSARLAEMLEESALYSEHLQCISANVMLFVLVLFLLCLLVIGFGITPYVERETLYTIVRVFMAFLVFVMSADLFGAYRAHNVATKEIREIRMRLRSADRAGYPLTDVLLAYSDYNAAVESAPESVPFVYQFYAKDLDRRWKTYQADRANARETK